MDKKKVINILHASNRPSRLKGAHAPFSAPAVPYKAGATTGNTLSDLICESSRSWWLFDSHQQTVMKRFLCATIVALLVIQAVMAAVPYPPPLDRNLSEDYNENVDMYLKADKRACIRRGGGCDGKPNDCCPNSSCRCNLWGTNCRCERAGLFQQWGK